jgi:hypothetical protein
MAAVCPLALRFLYKEAAAEVGSGLMPRFMETVALHARWKMLCSPFTLSLQGWQQGHIHGVATMALLQAAQSSSRRVILGIKRATLSNAFKAACLAGAADLSIQVTCNKPRSIWDLNFRRIASFAAFSLVYTGGFQVALYRGFDHIVGAGQCVRVALTKVAMDCFVHAPVLYIPSFYVSTGLMQGLGWSGSLKMLQLKYSETLQCYCMLWSWPMFLIFSAVSVPRRVVFIAGFAFIEKCIYSFIGQRD